MSVAYNYFKRLSIIGMAAIQFACQSPPEWAESQVKASDNRYLYGVGTGITPTGAQQSAVNQISAQLWTQLESTYRARDTQTSLNGRSHMSSVQDSQIRAATETLTFNGIEYPQRDKVNDVYYVQAMVDKAVFALQLQQELDTLNHNATQALQNAQYQDALLWWRSQSRITEYLHQAQVRVSLLSYLQPQSNPSLNSLRQLADKVAQVQSELLIYVKHSKQDKLLASLLTSKLNQQHIATTTFPSNAVTHTIELRTSRSQSYLSQAYITTQTLHVKTQNRAKRTLASNEIIATGNSVSSYSYAEQGATRHAISQVEQQGLWTALGFPKNE